MKYLVVYASRTGNTERLAEAIYNELPGEDKDLITADQFEAEEEADVYFVGFWTDRGTCPMEISDVLEKLEGKKIALFGTCGMGDAPEYYAQIHAQVNAWTPDEYEDLGYFMCQGRMQAKVKAKYESMEGKIPEEQRQKMLRNYETGQSHPDEADFENARKFVRKICK